jgi:hypothetical protein
MIIAEQRNKSKEFFMKKGINVWSFPQAPIKDTLALAKKRDLWE